jgi:hypothetical protein
VLKVVDREGVRSAEIKVLDIDNFYIRFVLVHIAPPDDNSGPGLTPPSPGGEQYTFATYPRQGKSDMVAESTEDSFGFYEPVSGDRQNISEKVLPVGVYRKFFVEKFLDENPDGLIETSYGMLNRQTEVEGPEVFNYKLTIPQVGTKTVLSIEGDKSPDYSPPVNELIEAVKFHHIEMTWDIKQGVFKIARIN